jgi:hypothetical protein
VIVFLVADLVASTTARLSSSLLRTIHTVDKSSSTKVHRTQKPTTRNFEITISQADATMGIPNSKIAMAPTNSTLETPKNPLYAYQEDAKTKITDIPIAGKPFTGTASDRHFAFTAMMRRTWANDPKPAYLTWDTSTDLHYYILEMPPVDDNVQSIPKVNEWLAHIIRRRKMMPKVLLEELDGPYMVGWTGHDLHSATYEDLYNHFRHDHDISATNAKALVQDVVACQRVISLFFLSIFFLLYFLHVVFLLSHALPDLLVLQATIC